MTRARMPVTRMLPRKTYPIAITSRTTMRKTTTKSSTVRRLLRATCSSSITAIQASSGDRADPGQSMRCRLEADLGDGLRVLGHGEHGLLGAAAGEELRGEGLDGVVVAQDRVV